ncbi:uncharacterized protein LOC113316763 [Papaver somniferum]|uniref:uncharacterized protein LOC113316763 n=1 Tax=Papaver somniferum TaxID=3469 RepID=UPI000E702E29|nr:uncharacterized protein LOC113316763 [Papaver somniferum]
MTFCYCGNNLSLAIANLTLPKFNLAHKGAAHRVETTETFGVPWKGARLVVANGSTAEFRVEADTKSRYTYWYWISEKFLRSKIKQLRLAVNISVNDQGLSVKDKLELSNAYMLASDCICTVIVALFVFATTICLL